MPRSSQRSLWPVFTAALIGLPLVYVAGFGPACWLAQRSDRFDDQIESIYGPLGLVATGADGPLKESLVWYANLVPDRSTSFMSYREESESAYPRWRLCVIRYPDIAKWKKLCHRRYR